MLKDRYALNSSMVKALLREAGVDMKVVDVFYSKYDELLYIDTRYLYINPIMTERDKIDTNFYHKKSELDKAVSVLKVLNFELVPDGYLDTRYKIYSTCSIDEYNIYRSMDKVEYNNMIQLIQML
jgi:hypothetical protein